MSTTEQTQTVEDRTVIAAPARVIRDLVADVVGWTQLHRSAIHAEILPSAGDEELIQHWSLVDDHTVRTWRVRRSTPAGEAGIRFTHEPADGPFAGLRGEWRFEERSDGRTVVTMRHEFATADGAGDSADRLAEGLHAGHREYLDTLAYAAENRAELSRLIVSFEDPLFVAGSIEDAYDYLYDAAKWEERIPHIRRLALEEPEAGVQFFDMETTTPDGSSHTTRSVRICLPHHKIVYKQIRLPALLDAHTGHWLFTQTPEGVIASARHTATIKPSALGILGEDTTVQDARNYLRRVLSANSMSNLRLAKGYAEELAGV